MRSRVVRIMKPFAMVLWLLATALLVVSYVAPCGWSSCEPGTGWLDLRAGVLGWYQSWSYEGNPTDLMQITYWNPYRVRFRLPLLPPAGILLGATAVLVYLDRRRRPGPGFCAECGYDLTGNVSGICPECGRAIRR